MKRILREALVIGALGLTMASVANLVSPRGLSLARDYFPAKAGTDSPAPSRPGALPARLARHGLGLVDGLQARKLFDDPRYEQERILFIDARDDRHYQEGHVPGAYQFDRYYPERHLPALLPGCLAAETIVVYCTGGTCEDSEFAALTLTEAGLPPARLLVYAGGMTEWASFGWPVETGARKSGLLRSVKP